MPGNTDDGIDFFIEASERQIRKIMDSYLQDLDLIMSESNAGVDQISKCYKVVGLVISGVIEYQLSDLPTYQELVAHAAANSSNIRVSYDQGQNDRGQFCWVVTLHRSL